MLIPVRCFTCGAVISDRWEAYVREERALLDKLSRSSGGDAGSKESAADPIRAEFSQTGANVPRGEILDKIGIDRLCCRRHFLGNVDLMDEL